MSATRSDRRRRPPLPRGRERGPNVAQHIQLVSTRYHAHASDTKAKARFPAYSNSEEGDHLVPNYATYTIYLIGAACSYLSRPSDGTTDTVNKKKKHSKQDNGDSKTEWKTETAFHPVHGATKSAYVRVRVLNREGDRNLHH